MNLFVLNLKIEKRSVLNLLQKFLFLSLISRDKGSRCLLFFWKNAKKTGKELFTGLSSFNQSARVLVARSRLSFE
jgi:hypothetical protein